MPERSGDPVPLGLVLGLDEAFRVLEALEESLLVLEEAGIGPGLQGELATVIRLVHGRLGSARRRRPVMTESDLLRPAEAARRLGVRTRVVIRAMYERTLPCRYLPDGTLGIPADALDDFEVPTP